jgi:hypothetical protein
VISTSTRPTRQDMDEQSWIEKRQCQRLLAVLNAGYRRLDAKESGFLQTDKQCRAVLEHVGHLTCAQTTDLSSGGLSLLSRESFRNGELLLVEMELPKIGGPFHCLGEVRWSGTYEGPDGTTHYAGLKFIFARPYDLARLNSYLDFWGKA